MRPSLKLKPIRGRQLNRLREMYDQAQCPRLRRRAQTILLAQAGYAITEIAQITRQSSWTVRRWLHRFMAEGCEGLWEVLRSGRPPQITPAIELFLREAVVKSPREYGLARPNWTTNVLSKLIKRRFKREVSDDCVWQHLHDVGGVCRRPTWTVRHRAPQVGEHLQPKKKPKLKELKPGEKRTNRKLARVRVRAEHAVAGIKICRITKDEFRNLLDGLSDLAMCIATGLHNFRRVCRRYRHKSTNAYFG